MRVATTMMMMTMMTCLIWWTQRHSMRPNKAKAVLPLHDATHAISRAGRVAVPEGDQQIVCQCVRCTPTVRRRPACLTPRLLCETPAPASARLRHFVARPAVETVCHARSVCARRVGRRVREKVYLGSLNRTRPRRRPKPVGPPSIASMLPRIKRSFSRQAEQGKVARDRTSGGGGDGGLCLPVVHP